MGKRENFKPPRWADRLLSWYCRNDRFEEIQGDLHELFRERINDYSLRKARLLYFWDVIRCFKSYATKRPSYSSSSQIAMFKNYFLIALRNLLQYKTYSVINISGLTLGIVCFTYIFLFVNHELSFDKFHENADDVYTVPLTWHFGATVLPTARATSRVGPLLQESFPEVTSFLRIKNPGKILVKSSSLISQEHQIFYADSTFFDLFTFPLLEGDPQTALTEPNSIVISASLAQKYFGNDWQALSLVGKTLNIEGIEYEITGLVQEPPSNSHLQFTGLMSFSTLPESKGGGDFSGSSYMTYISTLGGVNSLSLDQKVDTLMASMFEEGTSVTLDITPLSDIYLESRMETGLGPISDVKYIYIFSVIGLVIILIACINYMNLSTSRSVERAKEVGIRKVMGALRKQLTIQFLSESALMTLIALILGAVCIFLWLPLFNQLTGKTFTAVSLLNTDLALILGLIWFSVSLLAGIYPALVLSGFKVNNILKGSFKFSTSGSRLRRSLVIVQFTISATLIVATAVIYQQLNFIQNENLGFDQDQVIAIPFNNDIKKGLTTLKNELSNVDGVLNVAATMQLPGRVQFESTMAHKEGEENRHLMRLIPGDLNYINTLSLKLMAGEDFNDLRDKGKYQFIINEQTANFFGWNPEEALGQPLKIWNSEWGTITGVVKDFHFASLHEEIKPLIIFYQPEKYFMHRNLIIKLNTGELAETVTGIEDTWKRLYPEKPFSYTFLDDYFGKLYAKEQKLSEMFTLFAVIAIFIGCLGLFGLASYTAFQRSKEIGVRKVLGATVPSITILLSIDFTKQVIISLLLSLPLAYFLMDNWLQSFAYHVEVGWGVMFFSAFLVLLIAWLTVGYKSVRAALTNPVDTLRSE
ncbi:MAG: ABC transporter permease [Bacteroidota bacterium]